MTTSPEPDSLESRVTRVEEKLRAIERRMEAFGQEPRTESAAPALEESPVPDLFDFALVGKSVLIVGGAYLLRALTEVGFLPQRAGVVLALLYAIGWMAIADRALARGRRTVALFDASTAALIAAAVIWEATTRFHVFTLPMAATLTVIAALALIAVAVHRQVGVVALIAAAMTTFACMGLAIGAEDVLPSALAATVVGVVALRLRLETYVTLTLAIVSDFLALALMAMTAIERTPQSLAALALISIAALWVIAIEIRPRSAEMMQTAAALILGGGGASLFAFERPALPILWSMAAVATALLGRLSHRPQWTVQAPFWSIAATLAAFAVEARLTMLLVVGAVTIVALAFTPIESWRSRLVLLGVVTLVGLIGADALLVSADAGVLAMERSVVLALAAVALSFLGGALPEAAILARIVLAFAGLKLLAEDFRAGRATTIVVALAAYGTAMVLIARRRTPRVAQAFQPASSLETASQAGTPAPHIDVEENA